MQYVRSISGSVSKTWNSINPATLSGAVDVIAIEQEDGTLACSPFHVRFGKFSLLRPSEKKVEFRVNDVKQPLAMKLGDGGEAFFVFETTSTVPESLQTSPVLSPSASPDSRPTSASSSIVPSTQDLEPLDLNSEARRSALERSKGKPIPQPTLKRNEDSDVSTMNLSTSFPETPSHSMLSASPDLTTRPVSRDGALDHLSNRSGLRLSHVPSAPLEGTPADKVNALMPSPSIKPQALNRAITLSEKLKGSNIRSLVNEEGDLMLDMTGYKSSEEEASQAESLARQILAEELEGNPDLGDLIGADENGNLWIYSSEESKEAAAKKATYHGHALRPATSMDAMSDPGYQSDDGRSSKSADPQGRQAKQEADSAVGFNTPPGSPNTVVEPQTSTSYAKTLRLSSDQLKSLELKPGTNTMSFSVNRATCQANIFLWRHDTPVVVSDIDGTITKSDVMGHMLNMIGRDWTHLGVAKLFSEISANGYNIIYLTSRSIGQADTTRAYLNGILQEGHRLPKGPVIMSPDRTIAALRREVWIRRPEVFKMACLRDIMGLYPNRKAPFYAGFGNRLTDAISYRSVNIKSNRIFTINSNSEVTLDLLSLNKYKTGYSSMRETVDHFFTPVGMLVQEGGEQFTDFNYWREAPDVDNLSMTESESDLPTLESVKSLRSEDEGSEGELMSDDMADSYLSRDSLEDSQMRSSLESHDDRRYSQEGRPDFARVDSVDGGRGSIDGVLHQHL